MAISVFGISLKVSCQSNSLFLSLRAAVGMPKKFLGENSKAATARARKAEAKAVADGCKKRQEEDALWQETDKHVLKKGQRKVSCLSSLVSCSYLLNFIVLLLPLASRFCCFYEVLSLWYYFGYFLDDLCACSWNFLNLNKKWNINVCKHKTNMLAELSYLRRKKVRITVLCYWFVQ